jgi:methylated-DNA-[protein]-cysteine S-methyltransferase
MCALWTARLQRGLPGGQPRPAEVDLGLLEAGEPTAPNGMGADDVGDRRGGGAPGAANGALGYARCESPFGTVHLAASAAGVCAVSLYEDAAVFRARLAPEGWDPAVGESWLARAVEELGEYFAGARREFTVRVELRGTTEFDRRVLAAIAAIPYGETRTYGALAQAVGSPGAARAVGHACGRNPVPLLIACHRVVRAGGGMGGFGAGGPSVKAALLELENAGAPG